MNNCYSGTLKNIGLQPMDTKSECKKLLENDKQRRSVTMAQFAIELVFCFSVLIALGMLGVYIICMYLREFPKVKHTSEKDLTKSIYKTQTEVNKATKNKSK